MRRIPDRMRSRVLAYARRHPCLRREAFRDHECRGRTTLEHALIYAGRQVNEDWAIVPLCAYAHSVDEWQDRGILDKEKNEYLALSRMPAEALAVYPRSSWARRLLYLQGKYAGIDLRER